MGMSISMVDPRTGKEYHFSPARDIAYFWPELIEHAYEGLLSNRWEDWYGDYLRAKGVTEKEVMDALVAYSKFCMLSCKTEITTPFDALTESGFFKCPLPAQLVVMAKFGQLCTGAFWAGIRSAQRQGEIPIEIQELCDKGLEVERQLSAKWSNREKATDCETSTCTSACEGDTSESTCRGAFAEKPLSP
jgi:hypothetical protein